MDEENKPFFILCYEQIRACARSILQVHTLPVPTPIPTMVPHVDEHDGRYSDGTHSMFFPSCLIHALSELRLVLRYRGRPGSAIGAMLDVSEL